MGALEAIVLCLTLSAGNDTVLLDFYGDSCPPCQQMMPVVEQLAARGYPVRKVNVSREPALANQFRVGPIPCFVMLVNGREVDRVVGATSLARLERMCALGRPGQAGATVPVQLVAAERGRSPSVIIPAIRSGPAIPAANPRAPSAATTPQGLSASPLPAWQLTSPDWAAPPQPQGPPVADLLAATVRLRIEDPHGYSCGSGTIIDARQGQALILTCGHLFRESGASARIEVDLFGPTPAEKIPGRLVAYSAPSPSGNDAAPDLAFLIIQAPGPVAVARVAPPGHRTAKGARVVSVGCSNGSLPTAQTCHVTALDKFAGAANVEATGLPVQGRSGGGLFSSEGYVIGVCNAANPSDNEGLYAAVGTIHAELDRKGLAFVYRSSEPGPAAAVASSGTPKMPKEMPPPASLVQLTDAPSRAAAPATAPAASPPGRAPLNDDERAALHEIQRRTDAGAEVICIVRSRANPSAPSEVIVLESVSPAFVEQLTANVRSRDVTEARGAPPLARGTSEPSRRPAVTPVIQTSAQANDAAPDDGDWHPRWLQPGYQGS